MQFYLYQWSAIAAGLMDQASWQAWAKHPMLPTGEVIIDASNIPMMLRRRCSVASKMALSLSLPLVEQYDFAAGVFCSQHGELSNTLDIFEQLYQQEMLSPNKFSQCVHNTASGLLSVQKKLTIPFNSIAAGKRTFQMGLIDALVQIPNRETVLYSIFDEAIPEIYQSLGIEYDCQYALAMAIGTEPQTGALCLKVTIGHNNAQDPTIPPALLWISWLLGDRKVPFSVPMLSIEEVV